MHDLIKSEDVLYSAKLPSLSHQAVQRISEAMPEIGRAAKSFGRSNSQTTSRLMSLTMLTACSPYRVLRQCVAEIAKRQQALQEAVFNLKIDQIKMDRLRSTGDDLDAVEADRIAVKIESSALYIEGALKDIATFQDAYQQVRVANNIREDWDEADFEDAEVRHHTRTAFLHSYRDVMAGNRIGMGTLEYLEQFGIHPQVALQEAVAYYDSAAQLGGDATAEHLHAWLDAMADKYADAHMVTLNRLGLDGTSVRFSQYLTREE